MCSIWLQQHLKVSRNQVAGSICGYITQNSCCRKHQVCGFSLSEFVWTWPESLLATFPSSCRLSFAFCPDSQKPLRTDSSAYNLDNKETLNTFLQITQWNERRDTQRAYLIKGEQRVVCLLDCIKPQQIVQVQIRKRDSQQREGVTSNSILFCSRTNGIRTVKLPVFIILRYLTAIL